LFHRSLVEEEVVIQNGPTVAEHVVVGKRPVETREVGVENCASQTSACSEIRATST
jgi:hypothetical protein